MASSDKFRPKRSNSTLPIPATFQRFKSKRFPRVSLIGVLCAVIFINIISSKLMGFSFIPALNLGHTSDFDHLLNKDALLKKQPHHGIYRNAIVVTSPLIFPPIEHAPKLRELTLEKLFSYRTDQDDPNQRNIYMIDPEEGISKEIRGQEEEDKSMEAVTKRAFRDHSKKVFRSSTKGKSPEVVLVSTVDFDNYDLDYLTKVVQNRVDYAQKHGHGVYIRWLQEFVPMLQEYDNDIKWTKQLLLRAAMYAFPEAKYFWFLDQNAYIMRNDVDILPYTLTPEALDPIIKRDQPLALPNGIIKTYKNIKAEGIRLILTQNHKSIDTGSFVVVNDIFGRGLLDFWTDPLFRRYPTFINEDAEALTHILQWHPILLSKTAIVPARSIASRHRDAQDAAENDPLYYKEGDFVVSYTDCFEKAVCEKYLSEYHEKAKAGK